MIQKKHTKYLKIISKKQLIKNIEDTLSKYYDSTELIPFTEQFGYFNMIMKTENLAILEFEPFFEGLGFHSSYKTIDQSIKGAIDYLTLDGYDAKPFDLLRILEEV